VKQHQGIWLPDHEQHLLEWMDKSGELVDGRGTYQIKKLRAALEHVRSWRVAVDVGAHVGFWSMHFVKRFHEVQAFEPMAEHRECFVRNVPPQHVRLHALAVGAEPARVALTIPPGSSGGTHISGAGDIDVRTLDSFGFEFVDFLKIDCEGYELAVLQGAVETLQRCRPTIIVEQKAHTPGGQKHLAGGGKPAVDFLLTLGAKQRRELAGDYILTWD
jgi:FkbM family methyltransferase